MPKFKTNLTLPLKFYALVMLVNISQLIFNFFNITGDYSSTIMCSHTTTKQCY